MRFMELARTNFKEMYRNPLHIGLTIGLPVAITCLSRTRTSSLGLRHANR